MKVGFESSLSVPPSDQAEECYRKIEENFYHTYTTNLGTQIKAKLIELWSLSMKKSRLQSGGKKADFLPPVFNLAEMLNPVLKHPGGPLPGCFSK